MPYTVKITKVATGETREWYTTSDWGEGDFYWWAEGNMQCDCNRHSCFEDDPMVEHACTDGEYTVTLPDGRVV